MKLQFEPSDFESGRLHFKYTEDSREVMAEVANAKLQAWLAEAQVVYGAPNVPPELNPVWGVHQETDTHRALLINIEELPKEPCKHEPVFDTVNVWVGPDKYPYHERFKCKLCGVALKATWEAVK